MSNDVKTQYINLCMKTIEVDNKKFPVFYGYQQVYSDEKKDFVDVLVPGVDKDGKPTMKARNFKVVVKEPLRSTLLKDNQFPYRLTLQEGLDYFITVDKDKDKKPRLDKYGKKHAILVVDTCEEYIPLPKKSMTFDDMDDVE